MGATELALCVTFARQGANIHQHLRIREYVLPRGGPQLGPALDGHIRAVDPMQVQRREPIVGSIELWSSLTRLVTYNASHLRILRLSCQRALRHGQPVVRWS